MHSDCMANRTGQSSLIARNTQFDDVMGTCIYDIQSMIAIDGRRAAIVRKTPSLRRIVCA